MLVAEEDADTTSPGYRVALAEISRGVRAVSGLTATPATPGWIAIACPSAAMARWLCAAIVQENVHARCDGPLLLVPVGAHYPLTGEIKNVITAVAKTTHYWGEHLPPEVRLALQWEVRLVRLKAVLTRRFRRPPL